MNKIAEYTGNLLNHVETLYRPGERALAVQLVEALGCVITDTGFKGDGDETFLGVHPNPDDLDLRNNAFFMSPMRPEQQKIEDHLKRISEADLEVQSSLMRYRQMAKSVPFGVPHFALRYPSGAAVQKAADNLARSLATTLGDRLHIRVFRPEDADSAAKGLVQGFVYQDVIVSGSFLYGQLIELQSQPV